jgi:multisubunit Na+/H+ antiporter MnhC subunit
MSENMTDPSRSTAAFRAFVEKTPGEPEPSWKMKAPRDRVMVLAAIVVGVAVLLAIISLTVL